MEAGEACLNGAEFMEGLQSDGGDMEEAQLLRQKSCEDLINEMSLKIEHDVSLRSTDMITPPGTLTMFTRESSIHITGSFCVLCIVLLMRFQWALQTSLQVVSLDCCLMRTANGMRSVMTTARTLK